MWACFHVFLLFTVHSHSMIRKCVSERERGRLECDSCETLSVSLGKSGSSRITADGVYSCDGHARTREWTHTCGQHGNAPTQTCTFFFCDLLSCPVASCVLHVPVNGESTQYLHYRARNQRSIISWGFMWSDDIMSQEASFLRLKSLLLQLLRRRREGEGERGRERFFLIF